MNRLLHVIALTLLAGTILHAQEEPPRTWTLNNGATLEAIPISKPQGKAFLRTPAGRTVQVPLSHLSQQDRDYLATWSKPIPQITEPLPQYIAAEDTAVLPMHAWHIGNQRTAAACIRRLGVNNIDIQTVHGQYYSIDRTRLTEEETAYVDEWKKMHGIRTWNINVNINLPYPFEAMILDKTENTVTLRRLDGNTSVYLLHFFHGEDLSAVDRWLKPETDSPRKLILQPDEEHLIAHALKYRKHILVFFIGQKGGKEDLLFEQFVVNNPYDAVLLNHQYAMIAYYCDETGKWPDQVNHIIATRQHNKIPSENYPLPFICITSDTDWIGPIFKHKLPGNNFTISLNPFIIERSFIIPWLHKPALPILPPPPAQQEAKP